MIQDPSQTTRQQNYSLSEIDSHLLRILDARESLLAFTEYTKPDFEAGEHHKEICDALEWFEQEVEAKRSPRLLIEAPPRHTKSELASRRFPAWCLGRHPEWQLIATTYSGEFASDFGRDVRDIVCSSEYRRLFDTKLRADSAAVNRWQTTDGGVYVSVGVGGPITGRGAHIALIDDPLKNQQDADSETIKENIWKWYTSTLYTRLMPGGGIVIIMTRWAEDDVAGRALESENFRRVRLQAETDGKALWPEWYPLESLNRIKAAMPPRQWQALYQQNPVPDEGVYFSRESLKRFRLGEEPERLHRYIMSDFAVTADADASDPDYTVFGDWGIDAEGHWWLLDVYRQRTTSDQWLEVLTDWFKDKSPLKFFGEGGQIRRSIEGFLAKMMRRKQSYTSIEWITRNKDKQAMASSFRGMCEMGLVHIPLTEWGEDLVSELLKFPAGAHDDQVDMCSLVGLAVNMGVEAPKGEPVEPGNDDGGYTPMESEADEAKLFI